MNRPTNELPTKIERDEIRLADNLNWVDRTITFFAPTYGVKAAFMRSKLVELGYNDSTDRRSRPAALSGSEAWNKQRDRYKMMADARELAMFDWIGGMLAKVVLYVAGRMECESTTGDEGVDEIYDEYFHNWSGDEVAEDGQTKCDITGRHRLSKIVQLAFLAFFVDGDHGLLEIDPMLSPTGEYCLQMIEGDRIGSPIDLNTLENYIGGITIDEFGRIISYKIYERTRTNQYINPMEVEPSNFIHVFDPDRSDQYRGRSKLVRLLNDTRDIREWIEAEKQAGKTQSQWAALFSTKDPQGNDGAKAWDKRTRDGTPMQDALWGKILRMGEGEGFSMLAPSSRPSGAFMAFIDFIIRKMAASLNLPYGFLWDLSSLGGVTARIEVQGAQRQIEYWQQNIIVNKILNRVRQKVIAQGVLRGELPAHPNWKKCNWHFGPWIVTDAGYEIDKDIATVTSGIGPISQVMAKYGLSPREVFQANATVANTAIAVGEEQELPVEVFARGIFPDITQQKAAIMTPPPPPPPPGSIEALGDKAVGEMIKVLQSVKDMKMDRESAIATLIRTFRVPPRIAEEMVPAEPTAKEIAAKKPAPSPGGAKPKTTSSKKK